jgi:hypothetical protein
MRPKEKPMPAQKSKPAPLETEPGEQLDDNIDDLGHRSDGSVEDQPVDPKPGAGQKKHRDQKPA